MLNQPTSLCKRSELRDLSVYSTGSTCQLVCSECLQERCSPGSTRQLVCSESKTQVRESSDDGDNQLGVPCGLSEGLGPYSHARPWRLLNKGIEDPHGEGSPRAHDSPPRRPRGPGLGQFDATRRLQQQEHVLGAVGGGSRCLSTLFCSGVPVRSSFALLLNAARAT